MQETGMLGMLFLGGFMLISVVSLFSQIRQHPESEVNGLRYGLIIYTLLIPLWLWYDSAWAARVAMLLYWSVLGFTFREHELHQTARLSIGLDTIPILGLDGMQAVPGLSPITQANPYGGK
jgi:hypothetical protein